MALMLLLSVTFPRSGSGQFSTVKFNRLTTENTITVKGLSQNSVYCMMEDHRGFIWIGTWDGLNKYDGYDFIIYNTMNGLSHPTVNSLLEDDEKDIWIGTDDGLNMMEYLSGKIHQFHYDKDEANSLTNDFINHVYQDKKKYIWISTSFGLNRYDKVHKVFTSFNFFDRNCDSVFTNNVTRAIEDEHGMIWIGTHRGVHCLNPLNQSFAYYKMQKDVNAADYIKSNYVQDIAIDSAGLVYLATLNGLFVVKPGEGVINHLIHDKKKNLSLSDNQINTLLIDSETNIWIGTNNGLDMYDPESNLINSFKVGTSISNISNEDIRSIYEDKSGTIWIGTYKGLNKIDRNPSRFSHLKHDPEDPNSLSDNIIYAILEDENQHVWIGTYGGLNVYDRPNEMFSLLTHDPSNPATISSNKIRSIVLDSSGFIWVGTESAGLNRINRKSGKITHFIHDPLDSLSIAENNILSTIVDSKGRIWIGTVSKGLSILDPVTGKCTNLSMSPDSKVQLSNNKIICIYEDDEKNIWLGTNVGINKLSPDLSTVKVYEINRMNPHAIKSNTIFSIARDKDGIFWIGTHGGGLIRFDPVKEEFRSFTERDGLPNNVIYIVIEDEDGNLWITSNHGIAKFNSHDEIFIIYDTKDGVQGNEFNAGAYFKNRKGEIYFGGMNGMNMFHPREINLNKVPPRIVFTGLKVLNDLVETNIEDGEIVRLNYDENFFAISFSGLDYTNPMKNMYRYKLENYDNDWIHTSASQRIAEYRKVEAGTYRFLVTGSNNDGIWNPKGIILTIVIRPPWWENWIFRLALFVILVALLWSFIILRIRGIRKKHTVEKKMLSIEKQIFDLEQKALRLQMNPHFIFNSLNAIQSFVLANDTDKAVNYLAKFSHLMRMILANSTASLITLKDELKALTYYIDLEKLRFDDKFDYVINIESNIDDEFVEIPPMLFQPYVENAIIHGLVNSSNPGLLDISLRRINRGTLLCTIKDNGIGRDRANDIRNKSGIKRQPKGMMITQERIEIFNRQNRKNFSVKISDLKNDQGESLGTKVEFTIQYKET